MLFNSYLFVFIFLPLTMLLWYGLGRLGLPRMVQTALVCMSLWFYGYGHVEYIALILASVLGNYVCSCLMGIVERRNAKIQWMKRAVGVIGIAFDLGLLFYFKYYDFFIQNVNQLTGAGWAFKNIALPLGISFFTFQQISFLADRMMGEAGNYGILDYLNYVTFFPQLVAGPIVNHRDLVPQFVRVGQGELRMGLSSVEKGASLFIAGLAKKVLLADKLGVVVDFGYADVAGLDGISAVIVMLAYTFQIYFDFSGYCDMAVGLGWLLQIDLPQNFDSPYKSHSVQEFWRRWHMTLNAFFTKYVYIPLGGSRRGKVRQLVNIMIVFLLSGIWHGAAWTFVLWGMLHGVMLCVEHIFSDFILTERAKEWGERPALRMLRWCYTFGFVNLAWVLFRSSSVEEAMLFYRRIFSFSYTGKVWELAESMRASWNHVVRLILAPYGENKICLLLLALLLLVSAILCARRNAYRWISETTAGVGRMWLLAFLFALCVVSFSDVTTFLYFNF